MISSTGELSTLLKHLPASALVRPDTANYAVLLEFSEIPLDAFDTYAYLFRQLRLGEFWIVF